MLSSYVKAKPESMAELMSRGGQVIDDDLMANTAADGKVLKKCSAKIREQL